VLIDFSLFFAPLSPEKEVATFISDRSGRRGTYSFSPVKELRDLSPNLLLLLLEIFSPSHLFSWIPRQVRLAFSLSIDFPGSDQTLTLI